MDQANVFSRPPSPSLRVCLFAFVSRPRLTLPFFLLVVVVVQWPSRPGRCAEFAKLIEIDSAVSSRLAWEAFLGMAPQLSTKQLSPDPSEPRIHHMERGPDGLAGWKVYDDNKASWVDAWAHYYDEKSMKSKSSWAQYEREKHDIAQRRSRSGSDATRAPSPYKSAPAATKISFSLSIDTDISTAPTRSWKPEVRTMPRRRATMPIPSL